MAQGDQKGGLEKIQSSIEALRFAAFVVHPDQRPFSEYGRKVPENLTTALKGLMGFAQKFGFNADVNGDITTMINGLTAEQLFDIIKGIEEPSFTEIYAGDENPEIKTIIQDIATQVITDQLPGMSLEKVNELLGMEIAWGDRLKDIKIAELSTETLTPKFSKMDNEDTLAFLKSLPLEEQNKVLVDLAKEEDGTPIAGLDFTGMSIAAAIEARAEYGESNTLGGMFNWSSEAREGNVDKVYANIRDKLPQRIVDTIAKKQENIAEEIAKLEAPQMFAILQDALNEDDGAAIMAFLQQDGQMEKTRTQLKEMKDHSFLMDLIPDDLKGEAMFNKIRSMLSEHNLLGPAGGIMMQLISFVAGFVEKYAPGILGQETTDKVMNTINEFIDPAIPPQPIVEPTPEPTPAPAVTDQPKPPQ